MILKRRGRSMPIAFALALIALLAICHGQTISISDQQQAQAQLAVSESQQQQQKHPPISQSTPSLTQTQAPTTGPTARAGSQMISNAKSSMISTTEQPSALTTNSNRNSKSQQQQQTGGRQNGSAGRMRKPTRQQGSDVRTTTIATLDPTLDQKQEEVSKLALRYRNTPPLFITATRDFYVDVARHPVGFKLTTIQAIDMEGDQLEYSLQPAKFLDASPYFTINATSGELRLTNKRIFEPKTLERSDSHGEPAMGTSILLDVEQPKKDHQQHQEQEQHAELPNYLYFLNVAAWDGEYTSVIELKIHVSNMTHFGTNSPVRLTPEGGHKGAESLMRAKMGEFLSSLYSSSPSQRRPVLNNSTIVLPSFVNPPLTSGPIGSGERANEDQSTPNRSFQLEDTRQTMVDSQENLELDQSSQATISGPDNQRRPEFIQQQAPSQFVESPAAAATAHNRHHAALVVQQPMVLSIILTTFACIIIAFVLLMFIVPISVRRLKKRLKTMERQHEQLSQKASNGGSSITGSCLSHDGSLTANSMTPNGSSRNGCHGLPLSVSQFTLACSDRSCTIMPPIQQQRNSSNNQAHLRRAPLGRQSSLDSAITNNTVNYDSSQFVMATNQMNDTQSYMAAAQHHQRAMIMMMNSTGSQNGDINGGNQYGDSILNNHQQQSVRNNGLNRINNGAIVNPVYLHQLSGGNDGNSTIKATVTDNIYCPIDDEFYSTINTESTLVDDGITAHNYKLYARKQDGQPNQTDSIVHMLDYSQIGSLVGHTGDSRSYIGAGSAQAASFERNTNSPTHSTSSRSSTRSLARFLSLPARHWSHQQHESATENRHEANKRKGGFLDEFDFDLCRATTTANLGVGQNQFAKTIARADRIGHEQQVRHKRHTDQSEQDTCDRWEIERHKLRFLNILDEGQFGFVWRCKLKMDLSQTDGVNQQAKELTVAVKTLKGCSAKDARERDELLAEIEIMKLVCNHPNVVRILHCCTSDISPTRPILLVMEHVELGKLQSFLERSRANHQYATSAGPYNNASSHSLQFSGAGVAVDHDYRTMAGSIASSSSILDGDFEENTNKQQSSQSRSSLPPPPVATMDCSADEHHANAPALMMNLHNNMNQLTSRDLIKFIYHVAKGMEHVSSNCIVHRDLASRNILISSQRVCKIGDFGMARHMENMGDVYERHSRNTKVPVRWMAPEVLLENRFTTKSDVFSFGILMWEIVTLGSTPYRHLKTDQIIQAVARDGERPERPEYCHELLYNIMSSCWSEDPNKRPSFEDLVAQLDGLLMSTEEYIQLDQYPDHNYYNISQRAAPLELL